MNEPFPVHVVYLGPDGTEMDAQFSVLCWAIPRVGELVEPHAGGEKIVHRIYHRVVTAEYDEGADHLLATTIVLRDREHSDY